MGAADSQSDLQRPVSDEAELAALFHAAGKPREAFRIGAEHEKIGVIAATGAPVPYAGARGIEGVLDGLCARGWSAVREGTQVIALTRGAENVTIEPGGQLELSGAPRSRLREVAEELRAHVQDVLEISRPLGLAWLGIGFRPLGTLDDVPWVPKGRYAVMRDYLPTRGGRALEMMKRTATVQANLDFCDEADAARKLRAAMSVTSIVTAIFANSPIVDGRDSGFQSYRAHIWLDTDEDRCGLLDFAFADAPLFAAYTRWALDVPMFFVRRAHWGGFRPARGVSFRRFMREGFDGERATLADWQLHLSTLFPEARLKSYLELRGADAGSIEVSLAVPALWAGLLDDVQACAAAIELTAHLGWEERQRLRAETPRSGLATPVATAGGGRATLGTLARELCAIARDGLSRRDPEALPMLAPAERIADSGRAPADEVRELFASAGGDVARIVEALALRP